MHTRFFIPLLAAFGLVAPAFASSLHQFDARQGVTNDVCASLDDPELILNVKKKKVSVGHLGNICICVSGLHSFVQTDAVAQEAVVFVGTEAVITAIATLIYESYTVDTCTYPPHAAPECLASNPCYFTCDDGFTETPSKFPTSCECKAPKVVCNGVCQKSSACPTGWTKRDPVEAKRAAAAQVKRDTPREWWERSLCMEGLSVCGVLNGGPKAYECVNTNSDLWSCGGCTFPLNYQDATGTDCTTIPGISSVACVQSKCVVSQCRDGWTLSLDRSSCLPVAGGAHTTNDSDAKSVPIAGPLSSALEYTLEQVFPFKN